jgi:hypothetical protein
MIGLQCAVFKMISHRLKKVKDKAIPLQAWTGPKCFRKFEAPKVQDNRHMKVISLSALRTGRLYPPGNIPDSHFC